MVAEGSWRINDAHHMFWIFSSWCVKGELGLWDSGLGTPRGRSSRDTEEIERLIWYSSYAAMSVLGVDGLRGGGWGRLEQTLTHTHRQPQKHHIYEHSVRHESAPGGKVILFIYLFVHARAETHAVRVISLTCDLAHGAEYIEFFWVQRFDVVVDVPVNDHERSERHKQTERSWHTHFTLHQLIYTAPHASCLLVMITCSSSVSLLPLPPYIIYKCLFCLL